MTIRGRVTFHLGKPIGVMLALAVGCGAAIALRPAPPRAGADLTLWVSAKSHLDTSTTGTASGASLIDRFASSTGRRVDVELLSTRSEDVRLVSLFMSGSRDVPDAVEIEIGSVAKYFRPPVREVGLLPLNDFLARSKWGGQIPAARLAAWSKDGVVFGVPHDLHPVAIAYREDLFHQAGVDLPAAKTWPAFRDACLRFQEYWRARGVRDRFAIELSASSAEHLIPILLQRRLNPIEADGRVALTDEKFVRTLAFYTTCVAGPGGIAGQSPNVAGGLARDLNAGNLCALLTPDWRVDDLKRMAPELAGRLRLMPMPVFDPGDARTSTWGGTMIGIPRNCRDPEMSWKLIELLYFSPEGLAARRRASSILPPISGAWDDAAYGRGDPYFGGQAVGRVYVELARELPARYVTPATTMASGYLAKAVMDAAAYVRAHPGDDEGLLAKCRAWMADYSADLRRRIEHGRLD